MMIFLVLSILPFLAAGLDLTSPEVEQKRLVESQAVRRQAEDIANTYRLVEGKGIYEITDLLYLPDSSRRIVLFEYPSDGIMVKGFVSFVSEARNKPLLVMLRGGNRSFGLLAPNSRYSFVKDYTVLVTSYRGGVNKGVDAFGGDDVNDVKHLVDFIPELEEQLGMQFSNGKKYLMGASRGGLQMFLALARFPELQEYFDKAVSLSGLLDLEVCIQTRSDMKGMFERDFGYAGQQEWIDQRNPVHYASLIDKDLPLLLIQGAQDMRVCLKEGYHMLEALQSNGCTVEYLEVEDGDHCLENRNNELDIIAEWLEK